MLTVGGNDAGFATIGIMCLAPGSCDEKASLWLDGLDQVERALRATYAEVRRTFPATPAVVVPYPQPIADAERPCSQVSLTRGEQVFLRRFVTGLDDRMRRAAAAEGLHYLAEMESSLADAHLQLCDPDNGGSPGVNFIGLRSVNGIAEQRFNPANWVHNSLHPNERGHKAMLRTFESWLTSHQPLTARSPAVAAPPLPGAGPPAQCDLFDDSSLQPSSSNSSDSGSDASQESSGDSSQSETGSGEQRETAGGEEGQGQSSGAEGDPSQQGSQAQAPPEDVTGGSDSTAGDPTAEQPSASGESENSSAGGGAGTESSTDADPSGGSSGGAEGGELPDASDANVVEPGDDTGDGGADGDVAPGSSLTLNRSPGGEAVPVQAPGSQSRPGGGSGTSSASGGSSQGLVGEAGPDSNHVPPEYRSIVESYFSDKDGDG